LTSISEIKAAYKHTKAGTFLFNLCAKWTEFVVEHRWLYYLLACTWGIIMTIIGFIVSGALAIAKLFLKDRIVFKPYYWIYSISAGPDRWGGSEFGLCFLRDHKSGSPLAAHEFGHSFHNCLFGPLFPFVVAIPSAIWYWSRKLKTANASKPYDTMWFEDAATQCGLYATKTINVKAAEKIEVIN
jgi:hypothetical protein